jgi:metal-responsive CopG/Arc/MetJ family transcriptional regulator
MQDSKPQRKTQILIWIDPDLVDKADEVARDRFNGNRSELFRQAIRDLVEWESTPTERETREAVAS